MGQYPLEQVNSAPQVRTQSLWKAFSSLVETDFITGWRDDRRLPLLRYLLSGRLGKVKAIYLEAATSTSSETDLLFLLIAKCLRIPIGIYIRDGFPLFQMTDTLSFKHRLLIKAWHVSIWAYFRLADALFFPSQGLAEAFGLTPERYQLLPPGLRDLASDQQVPAPRRLLYAGGVSNYVYQGIFRLFEALDRLQPDFPDLQLLLVCRKHEVESLSAWRDRSWLRILHLDAEGLASLRDEVELAVLPLNRTPYADLAMPVKLLDYLSMGKPVLASDAPTIKAFIENHDVGLAVACSADDFETALRYCFSHPEQLEHWAARARALAHEGHRWEDRAAQVLGALLGPNWRETLPQADS